MSGILNKFLAKNKKYEKNAKKLKQIYAQKIDVGESVFVDVLKAHKGNFEKAAKTFEGLSEREMKILEQEIENKIIKEMQKEEEKNQQEKKEMENKINVKIEEKNQKIEMKEEIMEIKIEEKIEKNGNERRKI